MLNVVMWIAGHRECHVIIVGDLLSALHNKRICSFAALVPFFGQQVPAVEPPHHNHLRPFFRDHVGEPVS